MTDHEFPDDLSEETLDQIEAAYAGALTEAEVESIGVGEEMSEELREDIDLWLGRGSRDSRVLIAAGKANARHGVDVDGDRLVDLIDGLLSVGDRLAARRRALAA